MSPALLKLVYRPWIGRSARAALIGRSRSQTNFEKGRFTSADVSIILNRVWAEYDELASTVPRAPTVGSRMNLLLACMSFSCFRTLLSMHIAALRRRADRLGRFPGAIVTGGAVAVVAWFYAGALSIALVAGGIALLFTLLTGGMGGLGMMAALGGMGGRRVGGGGGFAGGGGGASGRW